MKITKLICSAGLTGFYFDDQKAIKSGARPDGMFYKGEPMLPGFKSVRQAGESISVLLELEDGQYAWGDCAAVQYSGAGGRDPLFLAEEFIPVIEKYIAPELVGQEADSFRRLAEKIDRMTVDGKPLHTAIRYGVTQAILDAVAKSQKRLMCEVVADEYGTKVQEKRIPILGQSGDDRYANTDKMIVKSVDVLPQGLINHVGTKLGEHGEILMEYAQWLHDRIIELRKDESYIPSIYLDLYGTLGQIMGGTNVEDMADYLEKLGETLAPFPLRVESPMDTGNREDQMLAMKALRAELDRRGSTVRINADEWCNTVEDVRYFCENKAGHGIQIKCPDLGGINNIVEAVLCAKSFGMQAYVGGSCNETDRSAQVCVHLAMAAGADQMLAKPGMGLDEGLVIANNEMQRILTLREYYAKKEKRS